MMTPLLRLRRQWLFWAASGFVYLFLLGPLLVVALASLEGRQTYHFHFPPENFSLVWYGRIPQKYLDALGVSLIAATGAATISTVTGAAAALGLARGNWRRHEALQAFFNLPLQVPLVVTGVVFLQFYNQLAILSGIDLLGSLAGLIIPYVLVTIPYAVGTVGAVLVRANPRLEEAARTLGASEWSVFLRVLLPLIKPGLFAVLLCLYRGIRRCAGGGVPRRRRFRHAAGRNLPDLAIRFRPGGARAVHPGRDLLRPPDRRRTAADWVRPRAALLGAVMPE